VGKRVEGRRKREKDEGGEEVRGMGRAGSQSEGFTCLDSGLVFWTLNPGGSGYRVFRFRVQIHYDRGR
jgi:hypothetical protein